MSDQHSDIFLNKNKLATKRASCPFSLEMALNTNNQSVNIIAFVGSFDFKKNNWCNIYHFKE